MGSTEMYDADERAERGVAVVAVVVVAAGVVVVVGLCLFGVLVVEVEAAGVGLCLCGVVVVLVALADFCDAVCVAVVDVDVVDVVVVGVRGEEGLNFLTSSRINDRRGSAIRACRGK